jgi:hypothetical protein
MIDTSKILIPRADIEAARDRATDFIRRAGAMSGFDIEDMDKLVGAINETPINPRLVPTGVVVYLLSAREMIFKALPQYRHLMVWILIPLQIELSKLPGVGQEIERMVSDAERRAKQE